MLKVEIIKREGVGYLFCWRPLGVCREMEGNEHKLIIQVEKGNQENWFKIQSFLELPYLNFSELDMMENQTIAPLTFDIRCSFVSNLYNRLHYCDFKKPI